MLKRDIHIRISINKQQWIVFFIVFLIMMDSVQAQTPLLTDTVPFLEGDPNFLFLGNSYTNYNNLPAMLQEFVEHDIALDTEGIILPGWKDKVRMQHRSPGGEKLAGHVQQLNGSQGPKTPLRTWLVHPETRIPWKWVILQDQSQIPGFCQLPAGGAGDEYAGSLAAAQTLHTDYIQPNGAHTLFFMTWGRRNFDSHNRGIYPDFGTMQSLLTEGYRRFWHATATTTQPTYMAPVGLVFETIYHDNKEQGKDPAEKGSLFFDLYSRDGSHPSLTGSYTAALTLYTTITGKDPEHATTWCHPKLEPNVCRSIQIAVRRTILETYYSGAIVYPWKLVSPQTDTTTTGSSEL